MLSLSLLGVYSVSPFCSSCLPPPSHPPACFTQWEAQSAPKYHPPGARSTRVSKQLLPNVLIWLWPASERSWTAPPHRATFQPQRHLHSGLRHRLTTTQPPRTRPAFPSLRQDYCCSYSCCRMRSRGQGLQEASLPDLGPPPCSQHTPGSFPTRTLPRRPSAGRGSGRELAR